MPREKAEKVADNRIVTLTFTLEDEVQIAIVDDGVSLPAWVVRATDAHVVVSLSHPWANGAVKMVAEVLKIREADADELEEGRVTPPPSPPTAPEAAPKPERDEEEE